MLNAVQFNQLASALKAIGLQVLPMKQPKAAKKVAKPKQHKQANGKAAVLAAKDQKILAGFKKIGIQDVVLMDRSDKAKPYNVKPYQAWLSLGQVVQKGQHGVMGLFHVTQTQPLKG